MLLIQLSETSATRRRIPVYLVDATDGFTPETGQAGASLRVSKDGQNNAAGGTLTEVSSGNFPGLYYYNATEAELDQLGFFAVRVEAVGTTRVFVGMANVVAFDPHDATALGLTTINDIETDTQNIQSRLPAALVGGAMDSDVSNMQANTLDASALATDAVSEISADVDTVLTAAHGAGAWTSATDGIPPLNTGTAQAGASTTITLAVGALATDDIYNGAVVQITGGTGAGQTRAIIDYDGTTKIATVFPSYVTNPGADSVYQVLTGANTAIEIDVRRSLYNRLKINNATSRIELYDDAGTVVAAEWPLLNPASLAENAPSGSISERGQQI